MTEEWTPVTSGVAKALLGPVLFIYINDIDLGLSNFISKFTDDKKIGNAVLSEGDRRSLQYLRKISDWSVKWETLLNIHKCQILQVGSRNKKNDYEMRGINIKSVHSVKDLGVTVAYNLKYSQQCNESEKKKKSMMGFIKGNFSFKNKECTTFV